MLARARTFTIDGFHARPVAVEVDIRPGLPVFTIVGLAGAAVREARDRVRSAILNCGYEFPAHRITANLAPGDVPKIGPALDLALACAVLAASGQLPAEPLERHVLYGELSLDGRLRPCHGTLAVALATREAGMRTLVLAPPRAREATLVDELGVVGAECLTSAVRILNGGPGDNLPPPRMGSGSSSTHAEGPDLSDVRGQPQAINALVIAAAGAHNLLFSGPPGTGKTMLAQRLASILPPMSRPEAIEVTRIASIAGLLDSTELIERRPFRAPHHSITAAGLVGGARGWVGEAVLAHHGVLFLDELSEFARPVLEALRLPLEDGRVSIVRAGHRAVFPSRFMLVAATNPCPCGHAGESDRCRCSEAELIRHRRRLSGPLLDRIDLLTHLERLGTGQLNAEPLTSSRTVSEAVAGARERQAQRLREEHITVNAHMTVAMLARYARLEERGEALLGAAQERGMLSARGEHRVRRVARTVADLKGSERVGAGHVAVALSLRLETDLAGAGT